MATRTMTQADVDAIGKVQKLKPTESDFMGKPGYKRTYRPDGSYTWRYRFKPNENGKMTREATEVGEMMKPFMKADTERHQAMQSKESRAALKDTNGATHFVDAALADVTARNNRWGHCWRAGGASVECGVDGMLFRRHRDGWEPTGRWCLTTPFDGIRPPHGMSSDGTVPTRGVQLDPDGVPWRFLDGEWRLSGEEAREG